MIAVLTGDIVYSTSTATTGEWLKVLKKIFTTLEKRYPLIGKGAEMHRGDGFQLALTNPEKSLEVALLVRAGLIKDPAIAKIVDTRIAIGIGGYEHLGNSVNESSGEAFQRSGHTLDELKETEDRLALSTPNADFNDEMMVSLKLADTLIQGWSKADAEIAWHSWIADINQIQIAELLDISQPAVSKRKKRAHIEELNLLLSRYSTKVKHLMHG